MVAHFFSSIHIRLYVCVDLTARIPTAHAAHNTHRRSLLWYQEDALSGTKPHMEEGPDREETNRVGDMRHRGTEMRRER